MVGDFISSNFSEDHVSHDVSNISVSESPPHVQIHPPLGKGATGSLPVQPPAGLWKVWG